MTAHPVANSPKVSIVFKIRLAALFSDSPEAANNTYKIRFFYIVQEGFFLTNPGIFRAACVLVIYPIKFYKKHFSYTSFHDSIFRARAIET